MSDMELYHVDNEPVIVASCDSRMRLAKQLNQMLASLDDPGREHRTIRRLVRSVPRTSPGLLFTFDSNLCRQARRHSFHPPRKISIAFPLPPATKQENKKRPWVYRAELNLAKREKPRRRLHGPEKEGIFVSFPSTPTSPRSDICLYISPRGGERISEASGLDIPSILLPLGLSEIGQTWGCCQDFS